VDTYNVYSNCNVLLLNYFNVNDIILLYDWFVVFENAKTTRWHHGDADNFKTL